MPINKNTLKNYHFRVFLYEIYDYTNVNALHRTEDYLYVNWSL
jgi:hypothetical protein